MGREFFDDDPKTELAKNGLQQDNFTKTEPWDAFPVALNLLRIWEICGRFVKVFVSNSYPHDDNVAADAALQYWMKASADPRQGHIRGLPEMKNREALTSVLTSLIYRITAHGISRLPRTADPWLTFVANFPPCLQSTDLPRPKARLSTQQLLKYLPNIGTIADQLSFYYAFAYSKPYVSLIPAGGSDKDLYFTGGTSDPRNVALIAFRNEMQKFMEDFSRTYRPQGFKEPHNAKLWLQWPRNIET
jgi:Lipoxygenase